MRESPVAIVCGYDRFSDLHLYAERVAEHLEERCIATIVVTGGFTSRDSWHSEASLMARVLRLRLPKARVLLEEEAMTTVDNLVLGRAIALRIHERIASFTVYCDGAHLVKVRVLARLILGRTARVHAVPRQVPLRVWAFEPVSILIEAVCAVMPPLQRALSRFAARAKGVATIPRRSARRAF